MSERMRDLLTETDGDAVELTPLIEIMLLLLAMTLGLMSTVPGALGSNLAKDRRGGAAPVGSRPEVLIQLDADGQLRWNDNPVTSAVIETRLAGLDPADEPVICLAAEGSVSYASTIDIRAMVAHAGFELQELVHKSPHAPQDAPDP